MYTYDISDGIGGIIIFICVYMFMYTLMFSLLRWRKICSVYMNLWYCTVNLGVYLSGAKEEQWDNCNSVNNKTLKCKTIKLFENKA